ncbi:Myb-like_DNA-binding domain-containing protein [Hexamita inflata]|uniref:Myb-like DNA-binding domain-containing protein n=1 Tax=Hexamita inflata TaxID=28002 RepID=A0AA86NCY4_9EUKA|nr:Myb-like DNA-binding domain-containing protein [Hexamita inflata]
MSKSWTQEEIQKLTELTLKYRQNNEQINWESVVKQMVTRSEAQCKSYYSNILKKQLNIQTRKNHTWNKTEILSLWTLAINYNADFNQIINNFEVFRSFTIKQLQSQWNQLQTRQKLFIERMKSYLTKEDQIQLLSNKQLLTDHFYLRIGSQRKPVIQKLLEKSGDIVNDNGYEPDMSEIRGYEAFFGDFDPDSLLEYYNNELSRRKLTYLKQTD